VFALGGKFPRFVIPTQVGIQPKKQGCEADKTMKQSRYAGDF
jgi:hypothetical protein